MEAAAEKPQKIKARANEIRALDSYRRAKRVTLIPLAGRVGKSKSTLSLMLSGHIPMTREEVQTIREAIQELSR